eukprot:2776827-Rhodomonas_salina.1
MRTEVCSECPQQYTCEQEGTVVPRICPMGFYCPTNNSSPVPCPIGTIGIKLGLGETSECELCPPGKYCASLGMTEATGDCMAGYFC